MTFIRAFFAAEIDDRDMIRKIMKIQDAIDVPDSRIKFVEPENLHLTLKFLGDINEAIIPELQVAAEKISFPKFELELSGMGCLPNFSYINALYIGVIKGKEELAAIAKGLEDLSSRFNFKKEKRPFTAHLTIGRLKKIRDKSLLVDKIKENEETYFGKVSMEKFVLRKSELTPRGPIYTTIFEVSGT